MDRETESVFIVGIFFGFLIGFGAAFIWRLMIEKKMNDLIIKKLKNIMDVDGTKINIEWPKPGIIKKGIYDMQICVPSNWNDMEIERFANRQNPCGNSEGWKIRKDKKKLNGDSVRNPCISDKNKVHVTLDA